MRNAIAWLVGLVVLLVAKSAWAAFHFMQITEVFPGTTASPNAQYIELQMYTANQTVVTNHFVRVFDAMGNSVGTFTFTNDVANGANQATILIATTQAVTLFGIASDLTMTASLPLAGGKVCFENIDCVAWGNYTGGATPSPVGEPAYQARGLTLGQSLKRKLGANNMLDAGDDMDISSANFEKGVPSPKNNVGATGVNPVSTCGNNTTEGLETCDDNNTVANDGCSATCHTENCGDGIVQTTEQCDDTNTNMADTCSNTCMTQEAQPDGPPDAGVNPTPDSGTTPTDDGGGGCCQTGGAGASPLLALLVLGLLLRRRVV
jgi:MYXO-CTERM domain-containing protein